jgi:hypothetical protein
MTVPLTISDLRRRTGKPSHVINHALLRYGPEPLMKIGICRVWSEEQLPLIEESIRKTAANRTSEPVEVEGASA